MTIFSKLFGRKTSPENVSDEGTDAPLVEDAISALDIDTRRAAKKVVPIDFGEKTEADTASAADDTEPDTASAVDETASAADDNALVNIWDLENDTPSTEALVAKAPDTPAPVNETARPQGVAPARRRRNKTRLLGFEKSDGQVVDIFAGNVTPPPETGLKFPVGWIIVVDGPGHGSCFTLQAGMTQFGRGEDQTVQLDFGDMSISRTNHAAMVYDSETHQFILGHGGKRNLVRVNGSPLISNEILNTGDEIRIGETTLRFMALCSKEFNWEQANKEEEDDDVEIA